MQVLFVSRAFPPVIGGIERQNFEIFSALKKKAQTIAIINRHGKIFLPLFFPYTLAAIFFKRNQYDIILLGDGVLALVAWIVKLFSRKPVVCILHGLDVTFGNYFYRKLWLQVFFNAVDMFIAVGNETVHQATSRGVKESSLVFIPNGVNTAAVQSTYSRQDLKDVIGKDVEGPVLLTLGRLVRRKGVAWFIRHVVPDLAADVTYLVAGKGPEENMIRQAIEESGCAGRVLFLGAVTDIQKDILLTTADLFIQPNIPVANDMEGFGLVVLEAAMAGTYVVASELEGLKDAITDGKNGALVEAGNSVEYRKTIESLLEDPNALQSKAARSLDFVRENYGWDRIAGQYLEVLSATPGLSREH